MGSLDKLVRVMLHIRGLCLLLKKDSAVESKTWMCLICGWIYDENEGDEAHGIPPGTLWAQVPMNWTCPECGARKEDFEMVQI
jgi:rubredoxin